MTDPARERILKRLDNALGAEADAPPSACAPSAPLDRDGKVARLKRLMEAVQAEVHLVTRAVWTETLAAVLRRHGAGSLLYAPESDLGRAIDAAWDTGDRDLPERIPYTGPADEMKETLFRVDAAVTGTRGAVADVGALVLWPDAGEPRLMSLVPPLHIAVLEADRIHGSLCEMMQAEDWPSRMPTNALLISGPSKTADIEMTLAYGVHGPKALVVLILTGGKDGG